MNKLYMTNPFYNLDSPEERKEAKQEDSVIIPGLEGLLRKYEEFLYAGYSEKLIQNIDDVLLPEQINAFLQITKNYEEHKRYLKSNGQFISKLIQNSYDAGYNDFVLNTKTLKEIHGLGYRLKGKKSKLIEITIEGNIGCHCGFLAKNSNFKIKGNAGAWYGEHSNSSHYDFHGNFGKIIIGIHLSPSNCTFITYKKKLYKRLLKELPKKLKNKAILKDKNGKILEEKTL